ncbi:uncharacterized protein BT62DRAFT_1012092 [Guyanagaster necrorhizus]|uniref:Uncharacterized protein n=1 Tax=Guyanagaster necrorhizus TaxID=856835 RepID=A0A9P7VIB3_9AGAR|nr:uncharacterized protein BT62DRAFT_1012092 [Guyanagaster necrorhizus MCA 3950]KAG7441057.1 hypothetical protein BT62DRAFT_1012092 [Guyanagaster necrorhizus MCA 3950]
MSWTPKGEGGAPVTKKINVERLLGAPFVQFFYSADSMAGIVWVRTEYHKTPVQSQTHLDRCRLPFSHADPQRRSLVTSMRPSAIRTARTQWSRSFGARFGLTFQISSAVTLMNEVGADSEIQGLFRVPVLLCQGSTSEPANVFDIPAVSVLAPFKWSLTRIGRHANSEFCFGYSLGLKTRGKRRLLFIVAGRGLGVSFWERSPLSIMITSDRRILGMDTAGPPRLDMRGIISRITIQVAFAFLTHLGYHRSEHDSLGLPTFYDRTLVRPHRLQCDITLQTDSPVSSIHLSMAYSGKYSLTTVCAIVTA